MARPQDPKTQKVRSEWFKFKEVLVSCSNQLYPLVTQTLESLEKS